MKPWLTTLAVCGWSVLASGQGQVTFNNTATTQISTNSVANGPATGPTAPYPGSGTNQFFYALFAAPTTVTTVTGVMDTNWTFLYYATNTTAATGGRLAGGKPSLPSPYASGTTFNFLVRGWSSDIAGANWTAVQSIIHQTELGAGHVGVFGTSPIATIVVGGTPSAVPNIFGTTAGSSIPGFVLGQLPPGSAASPFTISAVRSGTNVLLYIPTQMGISYTVEYRTNHSTGQWETFASFTGNGATNVLTDSPTNNPGRFYRGVAH
jgi:hypothetical protein